MRGSGEGGGWGGDGGVEGGGGEKVTRMGWRGVEGWGGRRGVERVCGGGGDEEGKKMGGRRRDEGDEGCEGVVEGGEKDGEKMCYLFIKPCEVYVKRVCLFVC